MRWWTAGLMLLSSALQAQLAMPIGIIRGSLVSVVGGQLTLRDSPNIYYTCRFDPRTYFEREHKMTTAAALQPGDPVEVLADRKPGLGCYARTVQVVYRAAARRRSDVEDPTEDFAPRGGFAFGGRVIARETGNLTVRTRAGDIHLTLHPNTRFVDGGLRVPPATLQVNTHVFIRAGRDIDGFLEAFQVVWGAIITGP